ncbi:acidic mammalian chitinase isoform X1 [Octopus vulgaris]|uniref:Acidic mammalian chitinase isoform X1 n=2 Tax=Octopus vulgaris TaxID=6645 RepID=A0AA36B8V6_OCTVU|nr:acidic mammalian chitinase isoform X1 [Octopus vulgaris]
MRARIKKSESLINEPQSVASHPDLVSDTKSQTESLLLRGRTRNLHNDSYISSNIMMLLQVLGSLLLSLLALYVVDANQSFRRVCYYTNWSQYREVPAKFLPENIDPQLCTHIIYAFATLEGNYLKPFEWNDDSTPWMVGMYAKVVAMKQKNPKLVVLLSVGGWNMGSALFTQMASTPENRKQFYTNATDFLRTRGFDGLDMDWEYPGSRGSPPEDKEKFTSLMQETSGYFTTEARDSNKTRLYLTASVPAGKKSIDPGFNIQALSSVVDFFNLMSYDYHGGSFDKVLGHNCPLYSLSTEEGLAKTFNMNWSANYWVANGLPKEKLNIGMPVYGRGFKLTNKTCITPGCPSSGPNAAGRYTRLEGFLSYYEICQLIKSGAQTYWIDEQQVPYLVKDDQWIGYDDAKSLTIKAKWLKDNAFGGFAVWDMALDDFDNQCGNGSYYLINTLTHALQ